MTVLAVEPEGVQRTLEARAGDARAFAWIVAENHRSLLRVAYLILGDMSRAEDAVQSAWVKAWERIGQLQDPTRVRQWLSAVAANEARQLARAERRRGEIFADSRRTWVHADDQVALRIALRKLSPEERHLLAMRYEIGLSSSEVAAYLGITAGAARNRLSRAVRRLRKELIG